MGGHVPLPTPLMISIAIVLSIAILLFDTYRGRNFRYRPSLPRMEIEIKVLGLSGIFVPRYFKTG